MKYTILSCKIKKGTYAFSFKSNFWESMQADSIELTFLRLHTTSPSSSPYTSYLILTDQQ